MMLQEDPNLGEFIFDYLQKAVEEVVDELISSSEHSDRSHRSGASIYFHSYGDYDGAFKKFQSKSGAVNKDWSSCGVKSS